MIKQRHVAALLAEFLGTFILAVVVFAVGLYNFLFFTTIAAGVTLAILVTAFGKISGGHFNPIITIGLFVIRQVSLAKAIAYVCVQFLGGGAAYLLIDRYLKEASGAAEQGIENVTTSGLVDWNVATAEFLGAFVFATIVASVVLNKLTNPPAAGAIGGGLFLGLTFANLAVLLRLTSDHAGIINPAVAVSSGAFSWVNTFLVPITASIIAMMLVAVMLVPLRELAGAKKKDAKAAATPTKIEEKSATVAKPATKSTNAKKPAKKAPAKKKPAAKKATTKKKSTK